MEIMDSYEQNLLDLFESCDDYYEESLSAVGLRQLCEKLKIEDSYNKLIQYLFGEYKSKRVLFQEFKEGLLKLLDGGEFDGKTDEELSPGREVPSKYMYSKKKYERHSRPENEFKELSSEESCEAQQNQTHSYSSGDSSSEESVPKKKRTRGSKRKGRSSFDQSVDKNDSTSDNQETSRPTNTMNEVEHLVTAWANISKGVTDNLSRDELVRVFQCVGLERGSEEAAQCVFEKLGFEENGRITLQELLEFIRSGGSWSREVRNQHMELEASQKSVSIDFIEAAGPACVTGAYLVEQWECAGVPGAPQLLQNLGFSPSQQIDLPSLVSLLTEEIKGLSDEIKSTRRGLDPHVALLRANSVLQNLYIQSLKTTIEHVNAEKEKLRNDVIDANQRALLLAQEVDDHHSKLEHSTQQRVKVLEQKHAEKIRELTNQAKAEQDSLLAQTTALEKKLKSVEEEESKNKAVISQLELENRVLEQEHRVIVDQLAAVQQTKEKLEKDLENASVLQQRVSEMELRLNENEVASLLERMQTLESENRNLRDRNDELSIEVEELSTKLLNTSIKKRSNPSNSMSVDQSLEEGNGGGAMKRRGDSFVAMESADDSGGEDGSPRLGKVRKCSHAKDFAETTSSLKDLQIHGGNRGECFEEDSCANEPRFTDHEDVSECKNGSSCQIIPFSEELEQAGGMSLGVPPMPDDWSEDVKVKLHELYERTQRHERALADEVVSTLREILEEKTAEKERAEEGLKKRCKELEGSLELLKDEYEKTEDYWSEKLEEERSFFEEEQKVSDKKYSELLEKILEYEEMLNAEREQRQRLETIEEKDSFEKQVADMEQECSELRLKLTEAVKEKEVEGRKLRSELERLRSSRECIDCGVQVSDPDSSAIECQSPGEGSENWNGTHWRRSVSSPIPQRGKFSSCRQCGELTNLLEAKLKYQGEVDLLREERERLLKETAERKHKLGNHPVVGGTGRIHELEQKCHGLMITLRQQQKQTEDILKNTWKQHKAEVKDLKSVLRMTEEKLKRQTKVIQEQLSKLAKTDLLVKDLFVENAYLISSVQKLEKQCQSCGNNEMTKIAGI